MRLAYFIRARVGEKQIASYRHRDFDRALDRICEMARLDRFGYDVSLVYVDAITQFALATKPWASLRYAINCGNRVVDLDILRRSVVKGRSLTKDVKPYKPPVLVLRAHEVGPGRDARTVEQWKRAAREEVGLPPTEPIERWMRAAERRKHGTPPWRQYCFRWAAEHERAVVLREDDMATVIKWLPGSTSPYVGPKRRYRIQK
jgi:hypothetical protein